MKGFVFKGNLGDLADQVRAKKKSRKKNKNKIPFSIFVENRNSDLRFIF